jgi:hypothetical protein
VSQILGEDAIDIDKLAQTRKRQGDIPSMNLGDFFFSDDEDLNPDSEKGWG